MVEDVMRPILDHYDKVKCQASITVLPKLSSTKIVDGMLACIIAFLQSE